MRPTVTGPEIATLRAMMMDRLIRMRVLDQARVQGGLVLGIDGTGYLVFRQRHCDRCLTRQSGEHTLFCHQALEAKILGPAETALSLQSEFIDNQDQAGGGEQKRKQDCELKASRRLLAQVRQVRLLAQHVEETVTGVRVVKGFGQ